MSAVLIITQDEFEMNMRLIGAPTLKDITRDMVDASSIHQHIVAVPDDRLFHVNCAYLAVLCFTMVDRLISGL